MKNEFLKMRKIEDIKLVPKSEEMKERTYLQSGREEARERLKGRAEKYFSKESRDIRKEKYNQFGKSNPLSKVKGDTGTLKKAFGV